MKKNPRIDNTHNDKRCKRIFNITTLVGKSLDYAEWCLFTYDFIFVSEWEDVRPAGFNFRQFYHDNRMRERNGLPRLELGRYLENTRWFCGPQPHATREAVLRALEVEF